MTLPSGINSGCNSVVEKSSQIVTNVTSGSPATTATQVIVLTYAGPLAKKLSGGKSGITRNACYVVYAALNKAGFMVVKTGTTRPAGAVASI